MLIESLNDQDVFQTAPIDPFKAVNQLCITEIFLAYPGKSYGFIQAKITF